MMNALKLAHMNVTLYFSILLTQSSKLLTAQKWTEEGSPASTFIASSVISSAIQNASGEEGMLSLFLPSIFLQFK